MTKEAETEQESSSGRNVVKVQLTYLGQVTESKDGNSIEEMFPKLTPGCNLKIQVSFWGTGDKSNIKVEHKLCAYL